MTFGELRIIFFVTMKPMKEGSIENTNVQMIQTRKLAVTVVLLGIEHLCLNMYTNPLTLPKKTGSKMPWGLNLGGPWKEAPLIF